MLQGAYRYFKNTDRIYIAMCIACSTLSVVALSSIGYQLLGGNYRRAQVQALVAVVGLVLAMLISGFDYHAYADAWRVHTVVAWGMVALTFVIGYAPPGTDNKAWIQLPFDQSLQPTEIAKISFILTLALHLANEKEDINSPKGLAKVLLHILAPAAFIHLQGDDGTMLVFVLIALTMVFAAGISFKYIAAAVVAVLAVAPLAWFFVVQDYQKVRILALFNPEEYASVLWQQTQGMVSIGSGRFFGKGFFGEEHHFVPLSYNDFIFSYIAESVGFIGSVLVVLLLLSLCARTLKTAQRSEDALGRYICVGVFAMLFWQSFINIGMCLVMMPTIGITLPLFSAGGTSSLTIYIAVGLVLSVFTHNKTKLFDY